MDTLPMEEGRVSNKKFPALPDFLRERETNFSNRMRSAVRDEEGFSPRRPLQQLPKLLARRCWRVASTEDRRFEHLSNKAIDSLAPRLGARCLGAFLRIGHFGTLFKNDLDLSAEYSKNCS